MLIDQWLGFDQNEMIETSQIPLLLVVYGAGFVAIQLVLALMYLRAYSLRASLELDERELLVTREEIQGFLLNIAVGLLSMAIAVLGGIDAVAWAGYAYLLLFPLQTINGRVMASRRRKLRGPAGEGP
jgi:hypothetical protein